MWLKAAATVTIDDKEEKKVRNVANIHGNLSQHTCSIALKGFSCEVFFEKLRRLDGNSLSLKMALCYKTSLTNFKW